MVNRMVYTCPLCNFQGNFKTFRGRLEAQCPECLALERHRLQYAVMKRYVINENSVTKSFLHFAPEPFLSKHFRSIFGTYETADIAQEEVDHRVDLQSLPFTDSSYDIVYASHVLEHIPDDRQALREIHRILRPGGLAVLPVPIMGEVTEEYDEPDPDQDYHVRAPGLDYFERYGVFSQTLVYDSTYVSAAYQPYIYSPLASLEQLRYSEKWIKDFFPICYK